MKKAKISFWAYSLSDDVDVMDEQINDLIDALVSVETLTYWDDVDIDFVLDQDENNVRRAR